MPNITSSTVRTIALALSVGLATLLAGCTSGPEAPPETIAPASSASPSPTPAPITFTDDLGNQVVVKSTNHVVACMGSFANMWELAGGTLVGVSDDVFDQYTLTSQNVSLIGDFTAPNLEQIIALEPDFVIMTGASGGRGGSGAAQSDLKPSLDSAGIPVAYFTVTTFDDYLRTMKTMTTITGRADLYQQYGEQIKAQIDALLATVPTGDTKPTVAIMTTYSGGTVVQSSSTMTGAMLADLGADNIADQNPSLLRDFSLESLIDINPDFILIVPMGNDPAAATQALEEETAANPAWDTLDAVENGHYLTLDPKLFQYKPNADWAQSYQTLFDILYA